LNEAAADASATRTSAAHVAADLVLSPSDKKRRDSHFAAKDKRRLKKRERLDNLKDLAAIADEGANCEEETRAADDGGIYTQTQFIEHYGGTAEWDAAAALSAEKGSALAIPAGWVAHTDPGSGKKYFHHGASGETSWIHPAHSR
jgi:hypothetical protein